MKGFVIFGCGMTAGIAFYCGHFFVGAVFAIIAAVIDVFWAK